MARIRPDDGSSRWHCLLRWLREGDDGLDRAMSADGGEPAPAPAADPKAQAEISAQVWKRYADLKAKTPRTEARLRLIYRLTALLLCLGVIAILLLTAVELPPFGGADNPINGEVSQRYLAEGLAETGAVNAVAGMILDYRAFDTLGESNVLFVAVCAVIILLRVSAGERNSAARQLEMDTDDRMYEPRHDSILQCVAELVVPLTLLFGVYVILNGHLSPGGGFSGGAVMGAGLILYLNAFGFAKAERFFTYRTFKWVSALSLSFYALAKAYSFFTGANGIENGISTGTPGALFSAGLIPFLNIAVGLVVCCTMYALYTLFRKGDV